MAADLHYADYLKLDELLNLQHPVSFQEGHQPAHDEMLFVVIHQSYELWFKQMAFELDAVMQTMQQPQINDNGPDIQQIVHRLKRIQVILRSLVQQMDIMETMTPMDFLEFRNLLRPASGFQSWQFKLLEAKLGLPFEQRYGQHYYTSQLRPAEVKIIQEAESSISLLQLINAWLERMPFLDEGSFASVPEHPEISLPVFWHTYRQVYEASLQPGERDNVKAFMQRFGFAPDEHHANQQLSAKAARSALFILLYRGYPMLELPFQLMDILLEIDNQLASWRSRHMNMVRRMIGTRVGTGGSTGAGYLKGALDQHYIFREIAQLNSFLVERGQLPALPESITRKLGYQ